MTFSVGQLVTIDTAELPPMTGRVTKVEEHEDGSSTVTLVDPAWADVPGYLALP
jgi:hypothetical protein